MNDPDEDYAAYEVTEVEEVLIESARCFCWKGGREYRQVGWLRFPGTNCMFQIYRDDDAKASAVAVEQVNACDRCIRRLRELAKERGYELVERRRNWQAATREACDDPPDVDALDRKAA